MSGSQTAANNLALAVIVAGCVAPAAGGQIHGGWQVVVTLAWIGFGIVLHICGQLALGGIRQ
jgi:hypothetical protein